ncbi:hypothetical protein JSE7799_01923 [Jannaschia seosinensis]|uniref:DUF6473 domain-containing protein n=1 Tax=Jannaschia seosinensis TaxID=313367 RepID=A0A0M7B8Z9_9RHOB|nr:DUF6473 family protein [Jannaschia seosinensis]CUH39200.1 hypothetical protein JSE7799_01923 [Jannaschia seosinensis]
MSYEGPGDGGLDYYPCRYEGSRSVFRGPAVSLDAPFTAVIGGSEVYGRFVEDPFTDQLAERTGRRVVNLGLPNAGLDAFILDEALMNILSRAEVVIIQAMGAQNMSNRYYTVHPRRNDRFLKQSKQLSRLFRDVDFSDFAFTRHMLATLQRKSPQRFALIEGELRTAWVARMQLLLSRLPGKRVLLSLEGGPDLGLGDEPLFVNHEMMQALEPSLDKVVQCDVSDLPGAAELDNMSFPVQDQPVAERSLTPIGHDRIAEALARVVRRANGLAA